MVFKVGDMATKENIEIAEKIVTEVINKSSPATSVDYTKDPRTQVSKFPIEPSSPTDVIGVDYDPYDIDYGGYDQHSDVWSPNIPFHNYRQRHVSQNAFYAGYGATLPLPPCPKLWGDVAHYWNTMCFVGWLSYELPRYAGGAITAILIGYAKTHGWM